MEAAEALRVATLSLGSIQNPTGARVGTGASVVVIETLLSDQIPGTIKSKTNRPLSK